MYTALGQLSYLHKKNFYCYWFNSRTCAVQTMQKGLELIDNLLSFILHELVFVKVSLALCFVSVLIHFVFIQL